MSTNHKFSRSNPADVCHTPDERATYFFDHYCAHVESKGKLYDDFQRFQQIADAIDNLLKAIIPDEADRSIVAYEIVNHEPLARAYLRHGS